ncbi:MAG: GNAT family N-acetyltransferase [Nitrospirae bacterium]|nr:GNAT family N-acetyltransferase [Nitrospirota bacterium]
MPDQLIVRSAGLGDVDVLVGFSAAMAKETEGRALDRERLRQGTLAVLESPTRGFYLVAELPGVSSGGSSSRVVGQLLVTYEWSDWRNATFWWIQSVYVHEAWRRRGIYRRMHEAVIEQAKARKDVCGVRLYVEQENKTAQTVYQRVGLMPSAYRVFEEDFILVKRVGQDNPSTK